MLDTGFSLFIFAMAIGEPQAANQDKQTSARAATAEGRRVTDVPVVSNQASKLASGVTSTARPHARHAFTLTLSRQDHVLHLAAMGISGVSGIATGESAVAGRGARGPRLSRLLVLHSGWLKRTLPAGRGERRLKLKPLLVCTTPAAAEVREASLGRYEGLAGAGPPSSADMRVSKRSPIEVRARWRMPFGGRGGG